MRTNIELNDELLAQAAKFSTAKSKRELVEEALATYVAVQSERHRLRSYEDRLREIRVRTAGLRLRSDSRDILRRDRDSR